MYACLASERDEKNEATIETYELNGQLRDHQFDSHNVLLEAYELTWMDTRLAALTDWSANLLALDQAAAGDPLSLGFDDSDQDSWTHRAERGLQNRYFSDPSQNPDIDIRDKRVFHEAIRQGKLPVSKATHASY
jgi:hypothetical protein